MLRLALAYVLLLAAPVLSGTTPVKERYSFLEYYDPLSSDTP